MSTLDSSPAEKIDAFRRFWQGEGPSLILIPAGKVELYDTSNYPVLFENPEQMWQSEMDRARPGVDWPTDGIPTVRPNLGVIFLPSILGLGYKVQEGQMPWPGEPLDEATIRRGRGAEVAQAPLMKVAEAFYQIHHDRGPGEIVAYHADTQGVFDIAHLVWGDNIFYDLADRTRVEWLEEILEICLEVYLSASRHLKQLLGEAPGAMVHGHGSPQGVFFPNAGARIAEDTAILLSPAMIERVLLPVIERSISPFGGGFAHYCGRHDGLLDLLCRSPLVKAIDLGNPEMFTASELIERFAATSTVLHSRLAAEPGETWRPYIVRLARLVQATGARVILRPTVFPDSRAECAAMRDLWHELTA